MLNFNIYKGHNSGSSSIGGSQGGGLSVLSSSRLRTITNLTRKLSLSNSRILNSNSLENSTSSTTRVIPSSSRSSHLPHHSHVFKASRSMNGIGKSFLFSYTVPLKHFHLTDMKTFLNGSKF